MKNQLLLLSGQDIPFPEARVTIHQPRLREIALIGENAFYSGAGFLDFSKDLLDAQDKIRLENLNDFDIFMSIILSPEKVTRKSIENAFLVLSLLFPLYTLEVRNQGIILKKDNQEYSINKATFHTFKEILSQMFCLRTGSAASDAQQYRPAGDMAQRIADKLKKRHQTLNKLAAEKDGDKELTILSKYLSILAIGQQKDLNSLMNYTVYQLLEEFQRFQLKMQWDAYVQAKLAGASDLDEVDHWTIDLNKTKKIK